MDKIKLQELLRKRQELYISHTVEMLAAFNREEELSREYNGRQILEMIQNADDAGADQMEIMLDKENKVLTISNNGVPFSLDGIISILIANVSSKVSTSFIGNKGLGFRSIVFWAKEISVETGGCKIVFSREITRKNLGKEEDVDRMLNKIREDRKLSEGCIPVPMLGIPDLYDIENKERGCTISVKYKNEFEADIESQLDKIDDKTLLFLPNIKEIIIDGQSIMDADNWDIVRTCSGDLPAEFQNPNRLEVKRFDIKMAMPKGDDDGSCGPYPLYNYLPTNEKIGLPFIIHATLDLDSSRNHINQDSVNAFILQQAAEMISEYVDSQLAAPQAYGWRYYSMMTPSCDSSEIITENLHQQLREKRDAKKIYPVVGGGFISRDDYYYYDDNDSEFWDGFKSKSGAFDHILLPVSGINSRRDGIEVRPIPHDSIRDSLKSISDNLTDIKSRADLICHLVWSDKIRLDQSVNLLIDDSGQTIAEGTALFTPHESPFGFDLPDYVSIRFMHKNLYDSLCGRLREELDADAKGKESDARKLCRVLVRRKIADVADYDKSHIIRVIVEQTKAQIDILSGDKLVDVIKEMTRCLFLIYSHIGLDVYLDKVYLLDSNREVCLAEKLMLPTDDNRKVFEDSVSYLLDESFWGIDFGDSHDDFMRKLGVNRLVKKAVVPNLYQYSQWLIRQKQISGEKPYNGQCMCRAMSDAMMDSVNTLFLDALNSRSIDQIIYLVSRDSSLRDRISQDCMLYFKQSTLIPKTTSYSYLRYQFLNLKGVKNKVLPPDIVLEECRTLCPLLTTEEKKAALDCLTTNIFGMEDGQIVDAVNWLKETNAPQAIARKLYKSVIEALSKYNRQLLPETIWLYAIDESTGLAAYYPASEVYYTDNTSLPKEIIRKKNRKRLSYPSRQGASNICRVFGLEHLSEISPEIAKDTVREHSKRREFSALIERMKPWILMHYLRNTDSDNAKKEMSDKIRRLNVVLVEDAEYKFDQTGEKYSLGDGEFIRTSGIFYLKVNSSHDVQDIQESVEYCDAISEIFAIQTAVMGQTDTVIRIFQNLQFMKKAAERDFSDFEREQAFRLLGMSLEEIGFWKKLLQDPDLDYSDKEGIYGRVRKELSLPDDFMFEGVDFLKWLTPASNEILQRLNRQSPDLLADINLGYLHAYNMENLKNDLNRRFEHSLWEWCCEDRLRQMSYVGELQRYSDFDVELDPHKYYTSDEYDEALQSALRDAFGFELSDTCNGHTCLYRDYERYINECSAEQQSLFYFDDNEDEIKKIVSELKAHEEELKSDKSLEESTVENARLMSFGFDQLGVAVGSRMSNAVSGKRKGGAVHTSRSDLHKRNAGKKAELLVKALFEKEGYTNEWVSGNSNGPHRNDAAGYDFKYKKPGQDSWRYLEVKAFSGTEFIISSNELETSEGAVPYDIALVMDGNVYIIEDFFKSQNYTKRCKDYYISCTLPEIK